MKNLHFLAVMGLLGILAPTSVSAETPCGEGIYVDEESARNQAENRARLVAAMLYKSLKCDQTERSAVETDLAELFATHTLPGECDRYIARYFEGEYKGLMQRASNEYLKCYKRSQDGFQCIPLRTAGKWAAAVFTGFVRSVENKSTVDERKVVDLFLAHDVVPVRPTVCNPDSSDAWDIDPEDGSRARVRCEEEIDAIVCGAEYVDEVCNQVPRRVVDKLKEVVCNTPVVFSSSGNRNK